MPIDGDNVASIRVVIGTTAVGTSTFNRSASVGLTIAVSASGQQTDQQHFGTATIGVVISSTASASVTSTHSGTATASIVITTTAAGETGATHSGTASCQVNLSASAAGISFDTLTEVPDESGNGNNMTLFNGPLFTSDSAVGLRATDLDGTNDYAQFSSTYQSVLRSSFSFSLWARLPDGDASFIRLLMNYPHGDSSSPDYLQFYTQSGLLKAYYRAGGVALSVNQTTGALGNGDSGWLHLVLVGIRTSSTNHTLKIYKNGSEVASSQVSGGGTIDFDDFTTTEKIAIGRQSSSSGSQIYHDYKIDDVSIWSKALSSTEVSNLYNSGSGSSLTGSSDLEGWWKMGDHSVVPITHSGTATVSVDVTASANGDLLELHSEIASIGVTILATASGTASQTHSGTASCQVNLSASASGSVSAVFNSFSASFDGTDDLVEVDGFNANTLIGLGEHTVSLWVKFDTLSNFDSLLYMGASTNNSDYLQIRLREVSSQLKYQVSGRKGGGGNATVEATTAPTTGSWVHLAYTRTGSGNAAKVDIYVNGSFEATNTNGEFDAPLGSLSSGSMTVISGFRTYTAYGIDGKMDEVAIWDSALSASEITKVYNSGEPFDLTSNDGNYTSSADLQGYWRFEDNTVSGSNGTIADSSGNSRTATTKNGVTFSTDVPAYSNNYSIALDGSNDYAPVVGSLSAGTYNFLTSTLTYSASLWFKLDDHTQNSSQVLLANNYTGSNIGIQIWYDNRSGKATKAIRVNSWAGSSVSTNTANAITDNNWHHVLVTSSGASGTLTVYLDGSSLTTASLGSVSSTDPNQDLAIGGRVISGSVNSPIDGKLDEVAIWDVALSSSDVTAIYNSGSPNNLNTSGSYDTDRSGDLQGYWRFEENTGTSIADNSGNGNTATLTNGPTFSTDTPS